jgi:hypothetical protein
MDDARSRQVRNHPRALCRLSVERPQGRRKRTRGRFPLHQPRATYFARCWSDTGWIERHELEKIFVQGDEAFVTYKCVARGGKSFRNTEFFTFEGDRIKRIDVYFGATYQNGAFVRQQEN